MSAFESEKAYREFAAAVRSSRRYFRDEASERFLATLATQANDKVEVMPAGTKIWRAQLGHDWMLEQDGEESFDVPVGYSAKRMKPLSDRAHEGRANPKGIPYLYAATRQETAMAEVRPWIGSGISVGQFVVLRDLRVVNCTEHESRRFFWGREVPEDFWDDIVWSDVDDAFSRPVAASDDTADYVPTQVIAELFKSGGFDGVAYKSALGDGHNIALFDLASVDLEACAPHSLKSIQFEFDQLYNPYFVKKPEGLSKGSV